MINQPGDQLYQNTESFAVIKDLVCAHGINPVEHAHQVSLGRIRLHREVGGAKVGLHLLCVIWHGTYTEPLTCYFLKGQVGLRLPVTLVMPSLQGVVSHNSNALTIRGCSAIAKLTRRC